MSMTITLGLIDHDSRVMETLLILDFDSAADRAAAFDLLPKAPYAPHLSVEYVIEERPLREASNRIGRSATISRETAEDLLGRSTSAAHIAARISGPAHRHGKVPTTG